MDDKTYIVGREGHIYLGDESVSRHHAEISFIDGKIRLRDLDSTNGIFVVNDNHAVRIREGYVEPKQSILIGRHQCTVHGLMQTMKNLSDETA